MCTLVPTTSTQLQNRSFHVTDWTRTAGKCTQRKNARAKRAKLYFVSLLNVQISDVFVAVERA